MQTLEEVLHRIENARRFGKAPGVEVTAEVLKHLGSPDRGMRYIHVAGTNGKGSTCAFLEALFMDAGYKVGKFTSPHLIRFSERITVNRKEISDEELMKLGSMLLERDFGVELTMFDYCLVMAILHFQRQQCDLVILETGLGGRLDSTSALVEDPLCNVITRIGYDHMAILGDSIEEIAKEKCGILRANVPVVVAPQEKRALEVILQQIKEVECEGIFIEPSDLQELKDLDLQMMGEYQLQNAANAVQAAILVQKAISEKAMDKQRALGDQEESGKPLINLKALEKATWPGRMQILSKQPFLMVDGAHNSNGVQALANSLKRLYPGETFTFVMGVMADKDYLDMIELLLPLADCFVTVTPESSRALQGEELARLIEDRGVHANYQSNWKELLLSGLSVDKKTICFGSLYFIGDVIKLYEV